ncbi:MAG: transcription initiation factor TFIIIB [Tepidibacter sp.]|jgi:RNA polymerase subunit RPABC4/transcription elongation factor Spt4|uniref:transcription initiation factor TFIIIB n=1 Tax=Tepidibacter sp. TaxID=2529387 RepID=UPI0025D21FF2|nr:transcription initiation factor TFIIIB [Tepidibacter sp.]MCT4508097.1 transcription initiation factor TFIIIB [Tepidibacter sp.]
MEKEKKKCPECGCTEIAGGEFTGYAALKPTNSIIASSLVIAEICTNCGYILNMRVSDPEKFKKSLI